MDTIPTVQRKSMPPVSRFSFVIILHAMIVFQIPRLRAGARAPGPARTIPLSRLRTDSHCGSAIGDRAHVVSTLCSFGGDVPRRVCRSSAVRAGCGVGAGRAGRASTPFHAGTAGPGRARARRPRDAAGRGASTAFKIFVILQVIRHLN